MMEGRAVSGVAVVTNCGVEVGGGVIDGVVADGETVGPDVASPVGAGGEALPRRQAMTPASVTSSPKNVRRVVELPDDDGAGVVLSFDFTARPKCVPTIRDLARPR